MVASSARVKDAAGRVVRRIDQDEPGVRGDGGAQCAEIGPERGRAQGDRYPDTPGHRDAGRVGVVVRLERDDLVAGLDKGEQRGRDRLGRPGGHEHLVVGVELKPVEPPLVLGDGRPQLGDTWPWRVLVAAARDDRVGRSPGDLCWPVRVGEALTEIDRAGRQRERGHLREDRRSQPGEPAVQQRPAHFCATHGRSNPVLVSALGRGCHYDSRPAGSRPR